MLERFERFKIETSQTIFGGSTERRTVTVSLLDEDGNPA